MKSTLIHWIVSITRGESLFGHSLTFLAISGYSCPFGDILLHSMPFEWLGMSFSPLACRSLAEEIKKHENKRRVWNAYRYFLPVGNNILPFGEWYCKGLFGYFCISIWMKCPWRRNEWESVHREWRWRNTNVWSSFESRFKRELEEIDWSCRWRRTLFIEWIFHWNDLLHWWLKRRNCFTS